MFFRKRAGTLLVATLLVYALLVTSHQGEFWPFSIYPMFSQAGRPWSRAVVRQVEEDSVHWQTVSAPAQLPGEPFAMAPRGIDPIDLSNFVSKTDRWDAARRGGLHRMFHDQLSASPPGGVQPAAGHVEDGRAADRRSLLVVRVNGRLREPDSIAVQFVPYALLRPDTTLLNPRLPR